MSKAAVDERQPKPDDGRPRPGLSAVDPTAEAQPAPPPRVRRRPGHIVLWRVRNILRFLFRSLLRPVLLILVPAAALLYGAALWADSTRYVTTENAYVKSNLTAVSAEVAGRVIEIAVRENQPVARGELLFRIDPRPFDIVADGARAALGNARTEIEALKAEYRAGLEETHEAEQRITFMARQFDRQRQLAERGVAAAARFDEAQNDLELAKRALATLRQRNRMVLAEIGGDPEMPVEAHPKFQQALADLDKAMLDVERTHVLAPHDGVVSNIELQLGEHVGAGTPLFALIERDSIWVEANLKETQLTHLKVGQQATLVADAYPDVTFRAVVDSLSPATGAEFALLPPQNASGNWVKVVQRLPVRLRLVDHGQLDLLRAGMSVAVSIDTERARSLQVVVAELLQSWGIADYVPKGLVALLPGGA